MNARSEISRLGAIGLVASGALFLSKSALELAAGPPPSEGSAILVWRDAQFTQLAFTSEVVFCAVAALVPGAVALYQRLVNTRPKTAVLGCGMIAVAVSIFSFALVLHGRLIYPVFGIRAQTAAVAELLVALYFGGVHAALLLFAIATSIISIGLRHEAPGIAWLGYVTSVADVAGSYPDAIGPAASFVCGGFFAAWLVAVGIWIWRNG